MFLEEGDWQFMSKSKIIYWIRLQNLIRKYFDKYYEESKYSDFKKWISFFNFQLYDFII
jgi:hypothetical protein